MIPYRMLVTRTLWATTLMLALATAQAGGDAYVRAPADPAIYAHLGSLPLARGTGKGRDFAVEAVTVQSGYAGYPFWLYVEARSLATQTVRFGATNRPAGLVVELRDADGQLVPMTAEGHVAFDKKVRDWGHAKYAVIPGNIVCVTLNLARHFDLSRPGKYSLTVRMAPDYPGAEDVAARTKAFVFTLEEPTRAINETSQGR